MFKKLLVVSFFFALIIAACSKSSDPTPTGTLTLTAVDSIPNAVDSITFTLYSTQANWNSKTNPIATKVSDANGVAVFTGITSSDIFVRAEQAGVWSNANGGPTSSRNLTNISTSGATAKNILVHDVRLLCARTSRGTLLVNNTTPNTYSITQDGSLISGLTIAASTTANLSGPEGTFLLTFTRLTGTTGAAVIDKEVTLTVCGTTTITLP